MVGGATLKTHQWMSIIMLNMQPAVWTQIVTLKSTNASVAATESAKTISSVKACKVSHTVYIQANWLSYNEI